MSRLLNPSLPRIVVLTGNPRPASRTRTVASVVAERISVKFAADLSDFSGSSDLSDRPGSSVEPGSTTAPLDIDLAVLARDLFAEGNGLVAAALDAVRDADVLVVATPVYKGSYTGLLKAFLDLLPSAALAGVVAVPVIVSAAPAHQAVAEVHLHPLLVELGATVPTRAFSIVEAALPDLDTHVEGWAAANADLIRTAAAVLAARTPAVAPELAR